MAVDLVIKNYRCFPDSNPARIAFRKGFTALVGPNNSGKSSLLRFFFEFRNMLSELSADGSLQETLRGGARGANLIGISDTAAVFSNDNQRSMILELMFSVAPEDPPLAATAPIPTRMVVEVRRDASYRIQEFQTANGSVGTNNEFRVLREPGSDARVLAFRGDLSEKRAYLEPMMGSIHKLARTTYLGAFRNAINVGGRDNYFDIVVGEQFIRAWRQLKTGPSRQQANAAFRLTNDIRRIFGLNQMEINTSDDNRSLQVFVDERPFVLDELGSGVAQFIMALTSLATRQQAYVLVDEPELNLHPSLQVDFLTTVGSYATDGVVFGTHSIGLARTVGQNIYALRRLREGVSEMWPLQRTPRLPELLGELSFSGYRELGFQKVLLVEGPSDVTTVQQFLRKRNLDHKILLLPLGGSTLINAGRDAELAELTRISNDIHVLIDSERAAAAAPLSAERTAFIGSCSALDIQHHVLDRRAMENYLSDRAVKAVMGPSYRALTDFERLKDMSPAWGKQENWRIAQDMTLDELAGTDLGAFIQSL
jgi:predicted ATPase